MERGKAKKEKEVQELRIWSKENQRNSVISEESRIKAIIIVLQVIMEQDKVKNKSPCKQW